MGESSQCLPASDVVDSSYIFPTFSGDRVEDPIHVHKDNDCLLSDFGCTGSRNNLVKCLKAQMMQKPEAVELVNQLRLSPHKIIHIRQQDQLENLTEVIEACKKAKFVAQINRGALVRADQFFAHVPKQRYLLMARAEATTLTSTVLIGETAALYHRLWTMEEIPSQIELFRAQRARRVRCLKMTRMLQTPVAEEEIVTIDDLPVVNVERTLLDIYRIHGAHHSFISTCSALSQGRTTREDIMAAAATLEWTKRYEKLESMIEHASADMANKEQALELLGEVEDKL